MQQQRALEFTVELTVAPAAPVPGAWPRGRCVHCAHGALARLEDPERGEVLGAGQWIRCELLGKWRYLAPRSVCVLKPSQFVRRDESQGPKAAR